MRLHDRMQHITRWCFTEDEIGIQDMHLDAMTLPADLNMAVATMSDEWQLSVLVQVLSTRSHRRNNPAHVPPRLPWISRVHAQHIQHIPEIQPHSFDMQQHLARARGLIRQGDGFEVAQGPARGWRDVRMCGGVQQSRLHQQG